MKSGANTIANDGAEVYRANDVSGSGEPVEPEYVLRLSIAYSLRGVPEIDDSEAFWVRRDDNVPLLGGLRPEGHSPRAIVELSKYPLSNSGP